MMSPCYPAIHGLSGWGWGHLATLFLPDNASFPVLQLTHYDIDDGCPSGAKDIKKNKNKNKNKQKTPAGPSSA